MKSRFGKVNQGRVWFGVLGVVSLCLSLVVIGPEPVGSVSKILASEPTEAASQVSPEIERSESRVQVGAHEAVELEINYLEESSWTRVIHQPDAAFIKVHFKRLELAPGDYVTVADPSGAEIYTYPKVSGFNPDDEGGFWALSVNGDTAIVRLHTGQEESAPPENIEQLGVVIDKISRGFAPGEIGPQEALTPESTCGTNQRSDVVCYQGSHPTEFGLSSAVVRVLITTGAGTFTCTGWRVSSENRLLTNEHCISSQADVNGTEVWFNFQRLACGSGNTGVVTKVTGNTLLVDDFTHDVALFTVNNFNMISSFGFLELDVRTPVLGEQIYIPQHGAGNPKEFGIESDLNSGNLCRIDDAVRNGRGTDTDTGYFCDTTGGSSGSPVLARSSHRVIGLHHFGTGGGNCSGSVMNAGVRIDQIWPLIQNFFGGVTGDVYEPDDVSAQANTIGNGVPQTHSIQPAGDEDWVTFTLSGESAVEVETSGAAGDTRMWLYDSGLNQLEFNDDGGSGLFSKIDRLCNIDALPAGTYYVKVDEFGGNDEINSYDLSFQIIESCNTPNEALLTFSSLTIDDDNVNQSSGNGNGIIECGETIELFVNLTNEGTASATGVNATLSTGSTFINFPFNTTSTYPVMEINMTAANIDDYDLAVDPNTPDGEIIQFNLNISASSGGGPWSDSFNVPVACNAGADPFEPDDTSIQATAIVNGISQTHSIVPAGDEDWVTFTLNSESAVLLETSGPGGDTRMWLYDDGLNLLEFDDDDGAGLFSKIDRLCGLDALPAGTYYVQIDEFGDDNEIPSYDLSFQITETCNPVGQALLTFSTASIDDGLTGQSVGNNNGIVECGETIEMFVSLANQGSADATGVSAAISTSSNFVSFPFNTTSLYPNITGGSTGSNFDDFDFAVDPNTPDGHMISFSLAISATTGGGPWSDSFTVPVTCAPNSPPNQPHSPSPGDGATDAGLDTDLTWSGGDPDPNDTVTYDVFLAAGNPTPTTLICNDVSALSCDPGSLSPGTEYFWQVIAEDSQGETSSGPVWSFITAPAPAQAVRGDCNSDQAVDAGDVPAITLEIFDGDGANAVDAPGGTFPGDPVGCDADEDDLIDAGDVSCSFLIIFEGPGTCDAGGITTAGPELPGSIQPADDDPLPANSPSLTIPNSIQVSPGEMVSVPVTFAANSTQIGAVVFSVDYDQDWLTFDPTDSNTDGIPDAVTLNLPGAFNTAVVSFDPSDADGEIDIAIADTSAPITALTDGVIVELMFQASSPVDAKLVAVNFSQSPGVSFGDINGQAVLGPSNNGSVLIGSFDFRYYFPVMAKND